MAHSTLRLASRAMIAVRTMSYSGSPSHASGRGNIQRTSVSNPPAHIHTY